MKWKLQGFKKNIVWASKAATSLAAIKGIKTRINKVIFNKITHKDGKIRIPTINNMEKKKNFILVLNWNFRILVKVKLIIREIILIKKINLKIIKNDARLS